MIDNQLLAAGTALVVGGLWPLAHSAIARRRSSDPGAVSQALRLSLWARIVSPPFCAVGLSLCITGLGVAPVGATLGALAGGVLVAAAAYRNHLEDARRLVVALGTPPS